MQFISVYFLFFFLLTLVGYYAMPKNKSYLFLLVCNVLFYLSWITRISSVLPVVVVIMVTWVGGRCLEYEVTAASKKIILILNIITCIGSLLYFKYSGFLWSILDSIHLNIGGLGRHTSILMPIGISFYTFQALSYIFEVYKGKFAAEHNFLRYATYVTFFPVILSGPIERPGELMKQLKEPRPPFEFTGFQRGMVLILWGG